MTADQLEHANKLSAVIRLLEAMATQWEKAEEPIDPSNVSMELIRITGNSAESHGLFPVDRDAWAVYRRACIVHVQAQLAAARNELKLL